MRYDPEKHHRRSIRLRGYDYTKTGAYFVTLVAQDRECLFGEVRNGEMHLSPAGRMIVRTWCEIPQHYPCVRTESFVLMPNHLHGVIILRPDDSDNPLSLGNVIQRFKTLTTRRYIDGVYNEGWEPFNKRLWQRNYYERIIRNEAEWHAIRQYIANNPYRWDADPENPINADKTDATNPNP
jgi:REP element-mobilizing transposase RayT